jgi:peptidoglycan hydrolase-like protein with peptidoglycan-binding domain
MSLIATVLWPGMHALEPKSKLGGILARKRGYHDTRKHHRQVGRTDDYSIRMPLDLKGPDDEAAAIDWTFPDAQAGDFKTIRIYSARLLAAGRANDPRTYAMREFFGNADGDRDVEGWDFVRDEASSSDSSHLWHIHISVRRAYVNDKQAIDAILSILRGEALLVWQKRWGIAPTPTVPAKPAPKPGDTYTVRAGDTLSGIAKTYRTTVATLKTLNRLTSDTIIVGQKLLLVAPAPAAPTAPKWPVGEHDYFRPRDNAPYYATVAKWQAQMAKLGWSLTVDGRLGPKSGAALRQMQKQVGLTVDGLLGKKSWTATWTSAKARR